MNGSHEFETGSSSAARVTATASGGSGEVGVEVLEPQHVAAARRPRRRASMPKPTMPSSAAGAGEHIAKYISPDCGRLLDSRR